MLPPGRRLDLRSVVFRRPLLSASLVNQTADEIALVVDLVDLLGHLCHAFVADDAVAGRLVELHVTYADRECALSGRMGRPPISVNGPLAPP